MKSINIEKLIYKNDQLTWEEERGLLLSRLYLQGFCMVHMLDSNVGLRLVLNTAIERHNHLRCVGFPATIEVFR